MPNRIRPADIVDHVKVGDRLILATGRPIKVVDINLDRPSVSDGVHSYTADQIVGWAL